MRQHRTRGTDAHDLDVELNKPNDLPPLAAGPANDTHAGGTKRSQRPRPLGSPPPLQDVDWENDATTHFRRDPSWSDDLSSLIDPNTFPSEPPGSLDPISRLHPLNDPPLGAPLPQAARTSLPAIEGHLARSMPPQQSAWLRSLWFLVPMIIVLAAGISWHTRSADLTALFARLPAPIARYLPQPASAPSASAVTPAAAQQPEPIVPEPPEPAEPRPEPAGTLAAPAPAPTTFAIPDDGAPEPSVAPVRERKLTRAEIRRRNREARRTRQTAVARPITPLRDSEPEESARDPRAANMGTLQINSRPWARVLVDGRFVGHTPQRALRLPAGRYLIELINDPLQMSKIFEVTILSGQTVTHVEMLEDDTE